MVSELPKAIVNSPFINNDENNPNANNITNYIANDSIDKYEQEEEDALINISDGVLQDVTL